MNLSKIEPSVRVAHSQVIQFYSSANNIGNLLPVLAIHNMLQMTPDLWAINDKSMDFNFINNNYKCAIIGGAGLLHPVFEPFWKKFYKECKIPFIMWGIGICLPDKLHKGLDKDLVKAITERCELINVRDELTAKYFDMNNAYITPCPSILFLQKFKSVETNNDLDFVLYVPHEHQVTHEEKMSVFNSIIKYKKNALIINNEESFNCDLECFINDTYCKSNLIITSRLHGAIIAYALSIPYIAIAHDKKLVAFHREYGNGAMVHDIEELEEYLSERKVIPSLTPISIQSIEEFGKIAKEWVWKHCS